MLKWVPDWKSYTSSTLGDTLTYYYIPLNPVATNTRSNLTINNVQEVNIKKFLLAGKSSSRTFYRIATYIFSTSTVKSAIAATGKNYNLDNFTGQIFYENLDNKTFNVRQYVNGQKINNLADKASTNSKVKPNYVFTECKTVAKCTYSGLCNQYLYITENSADNFCPSPPSFYPCFPQEYFTGWSYSNTDYVTECYDITYPDPPPPPPPPDGGGTGTGTGTQVITNNVSDPCLHQTVDKVLNPNGVNELQKVLYNLFSASTTLNLNVSQNSSIADYGDAQSSTRDGITTINIRINDQMLSNSSKELVASVIIHETLHAYMFANNLTSSIQHEAMAVSYINQISGLLKSLYPNLSDQDSRALSWGGLSGTGSWFFLSNLSPDDRFNLEDKQTRYTLGQLGTTCN